MEKKKDYNKLIKGLQIATGILLIVFMIIGIILIQKYNIKVSNIKNLSQMISGGVVTVSLILIGISVVKSFVLVFPPAVLLSICSYMLPNYGIALLVNIISVLLSLSLPYILGKFAGADLVDSLAQKFKAVRKVDDFMGTNEIVMTAVIKFAGIMPGDLSSLLFGAMNIRYKNYMIGSFIGNFPLVLIYTLFGILLKNVGEKPWVVAIPVAVIILFTLISGVLTKKIIDKNKASEMSKKTERI